MSKSALIVTHHIFLTKEQRYALSNPEETVECIGTSSPVWVKQGRWVTETAHEIFCKYTLRYTKEPEKNTVRIQRDGYLLTLTNSMPEHLKDTKDGGSLCLLLTHRNFIKRGDIKPVSVIHCVSIEDMGMLTNTLA